MDAVNTVNRAKADAVEHRPRLASLLQGAAGLEMSVQDQAWPPVLLEANALLRLHKHAEAKAHLDQTALAGIVDYLAEHPSRTDMMYVTAKLLCETGRPDQAEPLYRKILAREEHPIVYADLARLTQQNPARQTEALSYWQGACDLDPRNVDSLQAYACCARELGDVQQAVALQQRAVALAPDRHVIGCQLLWSMNCLPGFDRKALYRQAKQWARVFTQGAAPFVTFSNRPTKSKQLSIGIVSGNLINNSPLTFFQPALMDVNREQFKLYAYSNVSARHRVPDQVRALFDIFRDIRNCSDQEAATLIWEDGIDILIAFEGYCDNSRLGIFALKPAPIQVDWGGLSTLALPQIDYRITDEVLDPPDMQPYHPEELVYLSGGFVTYRPPDASPPVVPLPAQTNGFVTFGSFNSHLKINDLTLDIWTRILQRVPQARMVFKSPGLGSPGARQFLLQRLMQRGIHVDRIKICAHTEYRDYLSLLTQVDLLLDCYPFNGYRTALEGLWMGVPTLTLSGSTHVSRTGLAILKQLGLDQAFALPSAQSYVDRACAYAGQLDDLARIRAALRTLLLTSSLCDPVQYARSLEEALRSIWHRWCEGQKAG